MHKTTRAWPLYIQSVIFDHEFLFFLYCHLSFGTLYLEVSGSNITESSETRTHEIQGTWICRYDMTETMSETMFFQFSWIIGPARPTGKDWGI